MRGRIQFDDRAQGSVLALWLVLAGAMASEVTEGLGQIVALGLLAAVALCAATPPRWPIPFMVGIVGGLFLGVQHILAGEVMSAVVLSITLVLTGLLVSRWRPDQAGKIVMSDEADGPARPAPVGLRLPPGVADQTLFDRLAIHEMTRARRYERPLSLLLLGIEGWQTLHAERGRRVAGETLSALAQRVRRLLRDVDAIGVHGDGRLAVLLPETPLEGALIVAGRIENAAVDDVGIKVRVGAAVFPDDAVTIEALLREAEAALDLAQMERVDVVERARLG